MPDRDYDEANVPRRKSTFVRRKRRTMAHKTTPPSQDKLVFVFITVTAIFFFISISPVILDYLPQHGNDIAESDWLRRHNKTTIALRYFAGQQRLQQQQQLQEGNQQRGQEGVDAADRTLARGVAGLPMEKTPALAGAKHGTIHCPAPSYPRINDLAYWNEPGSLDVDFVSPFSQPNNSSKARYITFEPDRGGWNNLRMSLEIVIVFAAATGRTLVLPPDTPFYRLTEQSDALKSRHHGFAEFLDFEALRRKVPMMKMSEFLEKEGKGADKMFTVPDGAVGNKIRKAADRCLYVMKSDRPCELLYSFLGDEGFVPELQGGRDCLIMDQARQAATSTYTDQELFDLMPDDEQRKVTEFCDSRTPVFFGRDLDTAPHIHLHSGEKHHRLLNHFYTFLYFADVKVDHHFKRMVRDFLHYTDDIWCAASRVLGAIEKETQGSTFSSIHVRRGDFQYKKQKITAEDWYENTKELFQPNELIYVATDEKDRSFFAPLKSHYRLRFLDDYSSNAGLKEMDPNIFGMVDTIIASRGRIFVGTWFSTFTGYINRLRGYYGITGRASYYSDPERARVTHSWKNPSKVLTAREWPVCWIGIDGDEVVSEEQKHL
mmetsp:Transcript_32765/g.78242  ORF Transcript_32765/g.78242 Transcript_32765/m.78242 type:complete len:603 (-) Transcript_32765:25-1833(-)